VSIGDGIFCQYRIIDTAAGYNGYGLDDLLMPEAMGTLIEAGGTYILAIT
jgi:hypothetical protein